MEETERGLNGIELSLRDYVAILLRHKWLFAGVFGAVLIAAAAWTVVTPSLYESRAAVVLRTNNNQQLFPPVGLSQRNQFIRQPQAELEYVRSSFFEAEARAASPAGATVRPAYEDGNNGRSSQLQFVARAGDPFDAQDAAQAWAGTYLTLRSENDIDEVAVTILSSEALIAELEIEKDELLAPLKPIDDALLEETDSDTISRLTTQRLSLRQSFEDDLLPISLQLRTLSQDLSALRIASGYVTREGNSARLSIEPEPGNKVAPRVSRNMALASVLGLLLAAGAALLNENFRGVINDASDLASLAPDLPVLAQIPEFAKRTEEPLELAADAGTPYAQAFERVVSALLYERLQHEGNRMSVLVTSSVAGEGKTTVASHLALRLHSTPTTTILLDSDLRRPDVHATFGERQAKRGLSHLLQDREPLLPHLRPLGRAPRVRALFAGAATDDAAALLRQSFPAAVESLGTDYDLLVVDAPPVLAVTDAEVMAHSVDTVVVAVRAGETSRSHLAETLRKLNAVDAHVLGFILVAVQTSGSYGYQTSYDYKSDRSADQLSFSAEALELPRNPSQQPAAKRTASADHGTISRLVASSDKAEPASERRAEKAKSNGDGASKRTKESAQAKQSKQSKRAAEAVEDGFSKRSKQTKPSKQGKAKSPKQRTAAAERSSSPDSTSTDSTDVASVPLWVDGSNLFDDEPSQVMTNEEWADPIAVVDPSSAN